MFCCVLSFASTLRRCLIRTMVVVRVLLLWTMRMLTHAAKPSHQSTERGHPTRLSGAPSDVSDLRASPVNFVRHTPWCTSSDALHVRDLRSFEFICSCQMPHAHLVRTMAHFRGRGSHCDLYHRDRCSVTRCLADLNRCPPRWIFQKIQRLT